ncbi:MAG: hypothetical protein ABR555_20165, partial [Pyrinomonadaceae bacterium]
MEEIPTTDKRLIPPTLSLLRQKLSQKAKQEPKSASAEPTGLPHSGRNQPVSSPAQPGLVVDLGWSVNSLRMLAAKVSG